MRYSSLFHSRLDILIVCIENSEGNMEDFKLVFAYRGVSVNGHQKSNFEILQSTERCFRRKSRYTIR